MGTAGGRARRNRDGLGAGVEAPGMRSEVEAGAEAEAAEGRDFFLGGAGFAWWELRHRNRDGQRMDRGWASVLVGWSWRSAGGEKEVGVGAQVRSAEQAGPQFFLEWGWGLWWERGNCARVLTRASRNRDGLGAGVEAPRRRSEVEAGAEAGAVVTKKYESARSSQEGPSE